MPRVILPNKTHSYLTDSILHSCNGIQYTSYTYRDRLTVMDLTQRMSLKRNCVYNARIESSCTMKTG